MNIFKIKIPKEILLIISMVFFLIILRIIIFGSLSLVYILWNLFLATLPFVISSVLLKRLKDNNLTKPLFIIGGFFWLLLIPNAPYIITDLIHVGVVHNVPALYDSFLLFGSAWAGMLLGFHSLFHIEQIVRMKYSYKYTNLIISIILLLTSFGIYLGRFLRFNSWDIFFNHFSILKSVWIILSESAGHIEAYLYTALFFVFLYISYIAWKQTHYKLPTN